LQSVVQRHQVLPRFRRHHEGVVQRNRLGLAAALEGAARTSQIHQDAPHQLGGDTEEVGAVLPVHFFHVHQPQVSLIDQSSGLQGLAGPFLGYVALRQPVQLPVYNGYKLVERILLSPAPRLQQESHFVW
jgi:hypothetical protein